MAHGMEELLLLSARVGAIAVSAGLQGLVLATGVTLTLRLAPGLTAAVRSAIWSGALLCVVLLHLAPLAVEHAVTMPVAGERTMHADVRWSVALACMWAVWSLTGGVGLAKSAVRLRRIARGATVVPASEGCARLLQDGAGRRAELCVSDEVDRPSVAGFVHPRILLPPGLLEVLSRVELEQIVLHEMEHLRRRDDWVNLAQKVCLMLFPLNPALRWMERRVCAERELACDDRVLRLTRSPKAYATCLTNLAEHRLIGRGVSLALGAWERQTELARRVHRILAGPEHAMGRMRARVAAGLVAAAMVAGVAALARTPQPVSFAPHAAQDYVAASALLPTSSQERFGETAARPVLVNAVMREALPGSKVVGPRTMRARGGLKRRARQQPTRVMLTGWRVGTPAPITSPNAHATRISFAAVPIGDGWLIVQL